MNSAAAARFALMTAASFALATLAIRYWRRAHSAHEAESEVESVADTQERRSRLRQELHQVLAPKIIVREVLEVATLRQEMIIDNPHFADFTWSTVDQAERELIEPDIAMFLGNGSMIGIDCFEPERVWPEFSYQLDVLATSTQVRVGDFKITSENLPLATVTCLEELFKGEALVEGTDFTPFETTLVRTSDFVERTTTILNKEGRDAILQKVESALNNPLFEQDNAEP